MFNYTDMAISSIFLNDYSYLYDTISQFYVAYGMDITPSPTPPSWAIISAA